MVIFHSYVSLPEGIEIEWAAAQSFGARATDQGRNRGTDPNRYGSIRGTIPLFLI